MEKKNFQKLWRIYVFIWITSLILKHDVFRLILIC